MSFSKYAALVKNLRGVVLLDLDEPRVDESLFWLVKRFRYRDLGLTPSLVRKYREKISKFLNGNPFRELVPPVKSIAELVELFTRHLKFPIELSEFLIYSSTYISPGLLIGDRYRDIVSKLSSNTVKICRDLSNSEWKLHLRIADYTILDFYEKCVEEAYELIEKKKYSSIQELINKRKERIQKDSKRYWRISCEDGRPFIFYIDVLGIVVEKDLVEILDGEQSAGLAIVPVVYIPPGS